MSDRRSVRSSILGVSFDTRVSTSTSSRSLRSGLERVNTLSRKQPQEPDPDLFDHGEEQSFWKFHLIKFGPSMYLTTNPSPRHLHCRNAPGYFIRIDGTSVNFTMVFEDIETGDPLVTVQKRCSAKHSELHYTLHKQRMVHDGAVVNAESPPTTDLISLSSQETEDSESEDIHSTTTRTAPASIFQGVLTRQPLTGGMVTAGSSAPQINLQGIMIDGQPWKVGSIPRVRDSRLKSNEVRYISKLNVYFHCKAESSQPWKGEASPQVKAVFRECGTNSKKRLLRQINRLSRVPSAADFVQAHELDSPFENIKYHTKCGDGLFFDENPEDDEPDRHHKLGWLTVYDDALRYRKSGFFDLVVALTIAASHEKNC